MPPALPDAVACFFTASNEGDAAVRLPYLATDALVRDDGLQHQGAAAIAAWLAHAQATTPYPAVPREARTHGDALHVTADVSGAFLQSPLQLDDVFRLVDGKSAALEIH
ncbi:nuclear transport factor 2 family protein [Xanthomonas axonopodis pv. poinsettiicola]|uniref:nuclear transport factor 2 family protein n=1 Tax=Xanthomonas TaxID=338 RepID=UPI001E35F516|nr:nuclear transport factor 2 family protein [Xanthomonas codiaei]MCC8536055.1 nuclear transport factor 2 family protein [Xanthomonas codiaei]